MQDEVIFTGDFYCPENFNEFIIKDLLTSDILNAKYHYTNFEAPIASDCFQLIEKAGPRLQQSKKVKNTLDLIGVSHLCLANNHIFDNGLSGFKYTINQLQAFDIIGAGCSEDDIFDYSTIFIDRYQIAVINVCERQFGCYPYNNHTAGYAHSLDAKIRDQIQYCVGKYDHTIIIAHGGLEMVGLPLPQIRILYKAYIDLGASAVIGHHPHVIQGKELYNNRWIYYSLGNFIFRNELESNGCLVKMSISTEGDLVFKEFKLSIINKYIDLKQYKIPDATNYLNSNRYPTDIEKLCIDYYDKYLKKYLNEATYGLQNIYLPTRLVQFCKLLIKTVLGRSTARSRNMLLYHLLLFDTNRWTIDVALKSKIYNKGKRE